MADTGSIYSTIIQKWINTNRTAKEIAEELHARGIDEAVIAEQLEEFKKAQNAKRRFTGFIYTGIGAFLGFIACVLTLINPVPELYHLVLYGLTTLAIIFVFAGLYFVFE